MHELVVGTENGVLVSADSGETWSNANNGLRSLSIHVVQFDRDSLDTTASRLYAGTDLGIFESTNYGKTWISLNPNNIGVLSLAVHLNRDGRRTIIAGTYLEDGGPYLSTDEGTTWSSLGNMLPTNSDVFSVYMASDTSGSAFIGLGGAGVFRSTDSGANWNASNSGLIGTSVYSIVVADSGAGTANVLIGSYYTAYASHDGGRTWASMNISYPMFNRISSFVVNGRKIFAGTQINVFVSTDYGDSWSAGAGNTNITALAATQLPISRLFAGTVGNGVIMSTDDGKSWSPAGLAGEVISSLSSTNTNNGGTILLAGMASGASRSTDLGTTWSAVTGISGSVNCLVVNSTGTFGGGTDGVFVSADTGKTWTAESSGLGSSVVHSIALMRSNVFAATDSGVFLWDKRKLTWKPVNEGLLATSTVALAMDSTNLFVGTAGSSVWRRPLSQFGILTTPPSILSPMNDSTLTGDPELFSWKSIQGVLTYQLQIGFDSALTKIYVDVSSFSDSSIKVGPFEQDTTYYWRVRACSNNDTSSWSALSMFKTEKITSVDQQLILPTSFSFFQNYPNPFNPTTTIDYQVPRTSRVTLKVYDVLGREIRSLVDEVKHPGKYEVRFDGSNLPSGVYFCRLGAGIYHSTKKLLLLK